MTADDFVTRLFALWDDLPPSDDAARSAFLGLYEDPVRINGTELPVDELVRRARMMGTALRQRSTEVLSVVSTTDQVAVAFRLHGRLSGPLDTPLGPVTGDGEPVTMQVIDVLTLRGGRISELWMVADLLGLLTGLGVVELVPAPPR
jgi:ketosteroid isomerase-like protein